MPAGDSNFDRTAYLMLPLNLGKIRSQDICARAKRAFFRRKRIYFQITVEKPYTFRESFYGENAYALDQRRLFGGFFQKTQKSAERCLYASAFGHPGKTEFF